MNKFLDSVCTERTDTRYAVIPTVTVVSKAEQTPECRYHGDDVYLFVTRGVFEVKTIAKSSHHERVDMQARHALLGHLYGEVSKRVGDIQRAAYAEDIVEVIDLCKRLIQEMLTPTAKDRS